MPNPYINKKEQAFYNALIAKKKAAAKAKTDTQRRNGELAHLYQAFYKDTTAKRRESSREYLSDDVEFSSENINGREVGVATTNDPGDYAPGTVGFYQPGLDFIVSERGTPLLKGSEENAQRTFDHESTHAARANLPGMENYDSSIPWRDRPEEAKAQEGALNAFKERLKAMDIDYTPEMGTRYLRGIWGGSTQNTSMAPIKNLPSRIPNSEPLAIHGRNDPLSPTERNSEAEITGPSMIQRIIDQREGNLDIESPLFGQPSKAQRDVYRRRYSSLPGVKSPEAHEATTNSYKKYLMDAQIADGSHRFLQDLETKRDPKVKARAVAIQKKLNKKEGAKTPTAEEIRKKKVAKRAAEIKQRKEEDRVRAIKNKG